MTRREDDNTEPGHEAGEDVIFLEDLTPRSDAVGGGAKRLFGEELSKEPQETKKTQGPALPEQSG